MRYNAETIFCLRWYYSPAWSAIHRMVTSLSDAGLPANFVTLSRILAFYRLTSTRGAVKEEGGGVKRWL